jgi:hypothetical protein
MWDCQIEERKDKSTPIRRVLILGGLNDRGTK